FLLQYIFAILINLVTYTFSEFTFIFFFFPPPAPTEFYTLSLHDALPISLIFAAINFGPALFGSEFSLLCTFCSPSQSTSFFRRQDRKSTRLNSSHVSISYAVFCLKKKIKHFADAVTLCESRTQHRCHRVY